MQTGPKWRLLVECWHRGAPAVAERIGECDERLDLGVAIAMEVAATSLLKASNGFAKPIYGMASIALYSVCFWVLAFAFQKIPMAVAYAIWSDIGIAAITALGVFVFRQTLSLVQALCIALIARRGPAEPDHAARH